MFDGFKWGKGERFNASPSPELEKALRMGILREVQNGIDTSIDEKENKRIKIEEKKE